MIPAAAAGVSGSLKTTMPSTVATSGSTVAMIAALLAGVFFSPSVYSRYGATAVTTAMLSTSSAKLSGGSEEAMESISAGRHMNHEPAAENRNAYVVTVSG